MSIARESVGRPTVEPLSLDKEEVQTFAQVLLVRPRRPSGGAAPGVQNGRCGGYLCFEPSKVGNQINQFKDSPPIRSDSPPRQKPTVKSRESKQRVAPLCCSLRKPRIAGLRESDTLLLAQSEDTKQRSKTKVAFVCCALIGAKQTRRSSRSAAPMIDCMPTRGWLPDESLAGNKAPCTHRVELN